MAAGIHRYATRVVWTGNRGEGTASYRAYGREHEVTVEGRPPIASSSDPMFRGDAGRWNPEQLLVASLSECHLLSYLHQCAVSGVVEVADASMTEAALELHERAHELCFIASSVNFPVRHEPEIGVA